MSAVQTRELTGTFGMISTGVKRTPDLLTVILMLWFVVLPMVQDVSLI